MSTIDEQLKNIYKPEECTDENDCQTAFNQISEVLDKYKRQNKKIPYILISRYIDTRNKLIDFQNNNNNKNKTEMKKTEILHELETLKAGVDSEKIKNNPVLAESIERKIAELEEQLASIDEESEEVVVTKEPKAPKEPKVKVEKTPRESKSDVSVDNFNIGDSVSFVNKDGSNTKGELVKIELTGDKKSYNAYVKLSDGSKQKIRLHKLTK